MTAVSDATVTAVVADCLLFIIIIGCWLPKKKHFSKFVEQTTSDAVISRYIRVHYTLMRVSSFFFHVLHNFFVSIFGLRIFSLLSEIIRCELNNE